MCFLELYLEHVTLSLYCVMVPGCLRTQPNVRYIIHQECVLHCALLLPRVHYRQQPVVCDISVFLLVQELRGASVEQLESWVEDAKKNNPGGLNKLEFYLLNKYCVVGVSVSVTFNACE